MAKTSTQKAGLPNQNTILDVRKAFDNTDDGDLVTYDVDLINNNNNKSDSSDFEDYPEDKEYPVVGKDFDLATKLIHLDRKQKVT